MVSWLKIALAIGNMVIAIGGTIFFKWKSSNPIEEYATSEVKQQTGIDLTQVENILQEIEATAPQNTPTPMPEDEPTPIVTPTTPTENKS